MTLMFSQDPTFLHALMTFFIRVRSARQPQRERDETGIRLHPSPLSMPHKAHRPRTKALRKPSPRLCMMLSTVAVRDSFVHVLRIPNVLRNIFQPVGKYFSTCWEIILNTLGIPKRYHSAGWTDRVMKIEPQSSMRESENRMPESTSDGGTDTRATCRPLSDVISGIPMTLLG